MHTYTSSKESESTHLMLRIAVSRLTEEQRQMLCTEPAIKSGKDVEKSR